MMGYGSYGHGGFSSSSSNLSALAPPFTVSPKPNSSPLVDLTEPSYGVPLSSSLHNWLPPNYPNSGPGFFSNHNSEFNPMPSSNAFSYPSLQDIKSPNTHLPPVNPIASASADAFLGGQCSDGVATSLVEDKRYYPTYVPPAIQDHSPLVAPDEINYDCFSSSHVATLDRSSKNDYILPGLGYTADWGESQNRLGDWEHGKQVELEGSFCSKGIYKNYMNQGAHASKGLSAYEEASHINDMLGWEKHGGAVSMERSNDKSFSGKNPRIMPVDYSKTSLLGSPSLLPENHPNAPASSRSCQVPYSASFEKHMRQHDANPRDGASFMTSSPSLVIRPPDIDTSFSAPNKGPLKDVNFGNDAADPDPYGNNPSNLNEFCPLLSSNSKARFDTSQISIHLDRNNPISVDSFSAENEKMSKDKSISEDVLDQVFKAKSGLKISPTGSDGFNLALDFIEAINPVENSSESLDHYNPAVDSPCWKGAPVTCFSPFEASRPVSSQYMKKFESCNSSDFQVSQFFHLNIDDAVKLSSQNPNEKTVNVERVLRPNLKRPLDANSLFREPRLDDSAKAGSFHSKSSRGYEVQHSDNICEPGKDHGLPSKLTGNSDLKPSLTMQQKFETSKRISENKHSSETCVADLVSIIDFARYRSFNEPCHATENGLSSVSSVEDASSKFTKLHEADSTPKIDVQMLVNTMRSLSDVLLFHSSNDSLVMKEGDIEALKDVIFNLHQCILKDNEQIIPTQESLFPQQGTSQDLEELPKLPKEVSVGRHRLRKEVAVIAQDQLDHQCLHEDKRNDIGPGNKMDMASDSVSLKGDMAKEDNMTQAIMKVLSENFDYEEEIQPQSLLYKNLWLEAEAELCSINYKARYNRMKIEMEKSESHKAKENTMDVEEKLGSVASHDLDTVDKLAPETKGPSPDIAIQYTPPQDVIGRYGILKRRINYNSAPDVEELSSSRVYHDTDKVDKLASEATEAECLTQDSSIKNSPIVGTTCHADDVMARFHILKRLVDNSNSVKATDVEEPSSLTSVSPDLNKFDKLAPEATEAMGTLMPDISVQNSPISTTSCHADDVEASVMARFNVLKCRDDKLSSTDFKRQELSEFDHLGLAGERIHWPIIRDRSEDGSMDVELGPVLLHHTASSTEDKLTVKEFHLRRDDPVIQSCPSNGLGDPLPGGWYDSGSSDWEHVMKEELVG